MSHFVDNGWGDWWLSDPGLSPTKVTPEQVATIEALDDVESMGASDVRFGAMTGPIIVFHTDGRITEVAENGDREEIEDAV